ncbi:MAG: radical SAM protein [Xanthomonadales bacterium]|nr:radical SAM protein [Xanthomonadales bacterium]NIN59163.1 radical SAM protein [Xanthomonadales bacterium]NIN74489.1 radical SAM protein [Xanthomonadales bacterium]NIO12473.1 radical SAM protein [Xanthomonadales bacterium]NIP11556.1 radical SAM protein [Xanthomonadales bacterium]
MSCVKQRGTPSATTAAGRDYNPFEAMQPRSPLKTPKAFRNGAPVKHRDIAPQGVYRPDYNILTPHMRSPDYVQMSTAAAITLGVSDGRMYRCACTRCLNLLLTYPEGCRANCAYCGLARHREAERDYADRNFIRVDWPAVPMDTVVDIVARDGADSPFHRMCISMITHPRSDDDTVTVLRKWTDRIDPDTIPVSILSNPTTMSRADVQNLHDCGADIFTVALDAATPEIFDRTRGKGVQSPHKWSKYWDVLLDARDIFGAEKFGAHIIVGMGETEYEVLSLVQQLVDLGGHSHMFCFFPEQGSLMDHLPATPRDQWRRVQLGRYLIDYRGVRVEHMRFDEQGRVTDFGLPAGELDDVIDDGVAFRTSGCPGKVREDISACDRPYGDSPPSDIASYPFQPKTKDLRKIRRQLGIPVKTV